MEEAYGPLPNMKKFIEHYAEAFSLFQQFGFEKPLIYNKSDPHNPETVFILVWDQFSNGTRLGRQTSRLWELDRELEKYISCKILLLTPEDLRDSTVQALLLPNDYSLWLTEDLPHETLREKLIDIFGIGWVNGEPEWIKNIKKDLKTKVDNARKNLWVSFYHASSYFSVHRITQQLSSPVRDTLTSINIYGIWFGEESTLVFTSVLATNQTLKKLYLRDVSLTARQAKKFYQALKRNSCLVTFDISNNRIGSAAKHFGQLLKVNTTLESLSIGSNRSNHTIARAFSLGLAKNQTLKHLSLEECKLKEAGIMDLLPGLRANRTLVSLDVSDNKLTARAVRALLDLVESSPHLISIDLSFNLISNRTAKFIARLLRNHKPLVKLSLCDCNLRDKGVKHICLALSAHPRLRVLDLGNNEFGERGMRYLTRAICTNTVLRELSLNNGHFSTKELALLCAAIESTQSLTSLDLELNCFNNQEIHPIALALQKNQSLMDVTLGHTYADSAGFEAVALSLQDNYTLTRLYFFGQDAAKESVQTVESIIERNAHSSRMQRQAFIYILLLLNHGSALWKSLPLDIKLYMLNFLDFRGKNSIGKNKDQIQGCARFLFSHSQECQRLIKSKQKIIIEEKKEFNENYTFRFRQ